jgi:hypothetical protein
VKGWERGSKVEDSQGLLMWFAVNAERKTKRIIEPIEPAAATLHPENTGTLKQTNSIRLTTLSWNVGLESLQS